MIQNGTGVPASAWRILIVEDERIVARDIQSILHRLGYGSALIATNGEEAIKTARMIRPNLVLMDMIFAGGVFDGVQTASELREILDVPIIYVTGHSDDITLNRARLTEPYGYILKPINVRELEVTIQMSLYRHAMERRVRENAVWLNETLRSIGDGVIATDSVSRIKFLNPVAEALLGIQEADARGLSVNEVMRLRRADGLPIQEPVGATTLLRTPMILERAALAGVHDFSTPVICTVAPIHDNAGIKQGSVLTLCDISALHAHSEILAKRVEDVEQAKRMLERYFPENLVDYLVDEKRQVELEGKNVQATMLFCDVRNSTGIAEQLGPREFAAFLSELFSGLMDLTYANGGSVNKLLGDGLLITFGCPFPEADDTINCVRLALQIREYLRAFNDNRDVKLAVPLVMGLGISTGIVFAGNIGSPRHMEYTVLGDAVNLASRLEALTKTTGHDILLDSPTCSLVQDQVSVQRVGVFQIQGRKEALEIFSPVAML